MKSKIKAINYKHKLFEFYFDNTSDAFRYDMPLIGNINKFVKEKITHISLDELWNDFDGIYKNLIECINFTEMLFYEYALKVYTKKLSRDDLVFIAKKLPKRENWGNKKFVNVKNIIIKRFYLSNKEFSEALHKIENHMTLCTLIGLEKKYKHFSKEAFKIYKYCYYFNNKKKEANEILNSLPFDKITKIKHLQNKYDVEVVMSKLLLKSDVKLLFLFWTFGKMNDCFIEYIDYYYVHNLESNEHMIYDYARKLLFDASLQAVINGMKWTGQNTYANELERT